MKKILFTLYSSLSLGLLPSVTLADAIPISVTVLEFGGPDTLFVADSDGGKIVAYKLPPSSEKAKSASYNLEGAGSRIAQLLKVPPQSLRYHDLEVRKSTGEVYISLSTHKGGKRIPFLVRGNSDGKFSVVNLSSLESTEKNIANRPSDKVTFWRDIPAPTLTITDMDYVNGVLYVSSLSTGEFSSTLRKLKYPFDNKEAVSHIEIYHTVHNQTETRAPVRAMDVIKLGGKDTVLAAYTCTPLVTIPVSELKDGAHIKGKTVAELGYGNTPLDVIHFTAPNEKHQSEEYVLVIHKERSADLIRVADLEKANARKGISKPEMWGKAGVKSRPLPLAGVLQVADQNKHFIVSLKRNLGTGDVDIVSFRKGAYFRLNDFISEYNFPSYKYTKEQEMFRNFQNLLKTDSGYPEKVRQQDQ